MTNDDRDYQAVQNIARQAASEGGLPEGWLPVRGALGDELTEDALLLLGRALLLLDELWAAPDRSASGVVTGQLTAIALAEAFHRQDTERFGALLPPGLGDLADVTSHLAGMVAQLVGDRWPGEQELAYDGMRAKCTDNEEQS